MYEPDSFVPFAAYFTAPPPPELASAALRLSQALNLRGVFGVDFIVDGDSWAVLEVNPRPTAALSLLGAARPQALRILYAPADLVIPEPFDWPDFTADIPAPFSRIPAAAPIASIAAPDPESAKARAAALLRRLENRLR